MYRRPDPNPHISSRYSVPLKLSHSKGDGRIGKKGKLNMRFIEETLERISYVDRVILTQTVASIMFFIY